MTVEGDRTADGGERTFLFCGGGCGWLTAWRQTIVNGALSALHGGWFGLACSDVVQATELLFENLHHHNLWIAEVTRATIQSGFRDKRLPLRSRLRVGENEIGLNATHTCLCN